LSWPMLLSPSRRPVQRRGWS